MKIKQQAPANQNRPTVASRLQAIRDRLKSEEVSVTEVDNERESDIDNLSWNNRGWENGWANWGNHGT